MRAEGFRGRDRNSELSRLVSLLARYGPDLNEIAAQLRVHKATVRYWYKHLLLERGFSLQAVPNYRRLGLERLILIASLPPAVRLRAKKIFALLHEQCYVKEVERTAVEGRFMVHLVVPPELAEPCVALFRQLKRMGVFSRLQGHRFAWVRTPPMMGEHYDFRNAVWTYDWRGHEKVPLVPVVDSEKAPYDRIDLLILRELQADATRSRREVSRRLGMTYRNVLWHQTNHVRGYGLIDGYAVDWRGAKPGKVENSHDDRGEDPSHLPMRLVLAGTDEGARINLISLVQSLPFTWFEASGRDCYFASLYVPVDSLKGLLSHLRDLEIEDPEIQWYLTNESSAKDYGVSYHLFDNASGQWKLDRLDVIKKLENVLVEVRNA